MNREDILMAARNEKNQGKEYEKRAETRNSLLAFLVGVIVCALLLLLQGFIKGTLSVELIAVAMSFCGTQFLMDGIKLKKVHLTIWGCAALLVALGAVIAFLVKLVTL